MTEIVIPSWYGKHDNPHHEGRTAMLKKITTCEEEVQEITGTRAKHYSPRGQSQREIIKVAIDSQVIYKA